MSELIKQYYRLILHETAQKYAIAKIEGNEVKYPHQKNCLTEAQLTASIEGKLSLGVMLIQDKTAICKSGCIDIDIPRDAKDLTEGLALAQKLQEIALKSNLRAYIEFSGNRGYHLWIFANKPVIGEVMQNCLRGIALNANFEAKEIFPNKYPQESKVIKLPFTTHLKSSLRSGFLPSNFDVNNPQIDLCSQVEIMANFAQNDVSDILECANSLNNQNSVNGKEVYQGKGINSDNPYSPKSNNSNTANSQNKPVNQDEIISKLTSFRDRNPSCIDFLLNNGAPLEIEYNHANLTLVRYCLTRGFSLEDSLPMAESMAKNTSEAHSTSKDYRGKVENFKSAFNSASRNSDNYKFDCTYILSGLNESEASNRGCIGTKCLIHKNYDSNYQSDNSDKSDYSNNPNNSDKENKADTPNNPKTQNKRQIRLINALIFETMINLSNEGKELIKSQILRECERLEQNYLINEDTKNISDSIRLIEYEVIGYFLKSDLISDYFDIVPQGFIFTSNQTISDYLDYLLSLPLPSEDTVREYLEIIRENGIKKLASDNFSNYQNSLNSPNKEADSVEILNKSLEDTEKLLKISFNDKQILPLEAHLPDLYESLFTQERVSISTPSKHLNNVLNGGFMRGKLYVIGAPPASGKSTICAWCGDYASMQGFKVIYASYEMSREQLFTASLSRISGINSAFIEARKWLDDSYLNRDILEAKIEQGITDIADSIASNIHILECDESYTPNRLKTVAKKLEADLLIVDYLQLMSSGDQKLDNAYQETLRVSKIATELKRLARYLDIPIIAISDINKDAYLKSISGGDLDMGALRDSFKIAHSADVILLLQSGMITTGKGNEKTTVDQLDLLERKYPEKTTEIDTLKAKYPLNNKTADTYSRLSIVKNRGGKLGEPIFRYSRALHNFEPMDFEIEVSQDDSDF